MSDQKELGVKSVGDLEGFGVWDVVPLDVGRRGDGFARETTETQLVSFHLPTHLAAFNLLKTPLIRIQLLAPIFRAMSEGELIKCCLLLQYYSTSIPSAAAILLCTFDPPHLSWWVGL